MKTSYVLSIQNAVSFWHTWFGLSLNKCSALLFPNVRIFWHGAAAVVCLQLPVYEVDQAMKLFPQELPEVTNQDFPFCNPNLKPHNTSIVFINHGWTGDLFVDTIGLKSIQLKRSLVQPWLYKLRLFNLVPEAGLIVNAPYAPRGMVTVTALNREMTSWERNKGTHSVI